MKRLLIFLFLWQLLPGGVAQAQTPYLRVSALINWPDTVYNNQNVQVGAIVENIGTVAYQGPLQIVLQTDSGTFSYLYFNQSNSVLILPGDTLQFSPPNGYIFDSTVFRPGNNVVVVWPYSAQSIQVDTFSIDTYFINSQFQGIPESGRIKGLRVYPNPALDFTYIQSPANGLEGVRIFSITGQEMKFVPGNGSARLELPIADLPSGMYLIEIIAVNKERNVYRLIKE